MLTLLQLLSSGVVAGLIATAPPYVPPVVDATEWQSELKVATDGNGHYVAYLTPPPKGAKKRKPRTAMFYGTRDTLYRVKASYSQSGHGKPSFSFWEPRVPQDPGPPAQIRLWETKPFELKCGARKTEWKPASPEDLAHIQSKAVLRESLWNRRSFALARDESGTYFFVDHVPSPDGSTSRGTDWRVYRGKRGALKPLRLKNIVDDSEGTIFATGRGDLRLLIGKSDAETTTGTWIRRKKRTELKMLPLYENVQLIYTDLGPYLGATLGTPCDDM